ncbi:MAG: enoyl-CoA hydratase/isomerase family protein [Balneolales bacterium]|nr:enoyl-CoA hydratase/isomerase family protein [Balneolales bacterium]
MPFSTLISETDPNSGICTITINRPDKLNALNSEVIRELKQVFESVASDEAVKAVILTGSGDKAFVAGADIKELSNLDEKTGEELSIKGQAVFASIENLGKPVIALVNGYALGGGTELALSCHMRIATSNAVFGLPEVSLGLIPGYGGTQRLTRLVGKGKAMELILSGRMVKADEADALGIANHVYDDKEAAMEASKNLMSNILRQAPVAVARAIEAVNASETGKESGYAEEARLFGSLCATGDFKEGTTAFLEKRKPSFKGN